MDEKKNRIALNIIVKNEEKFLRGCLESIKILVDEIVLADTGSTDSTVAIASEYTDKVLHFQWTNDFSEARNFVLANTESEWVLYLDADERIDEKYYDQIRQLVASNTGDVFLIRQKNEAVEGKKKNTHFVPTSRLFRRIPEAKFENRIHEQIMPSLTRAGKKAVNTNIIMDHLGYFAAETRETKKQRNLKLLIEQVENEPNNFFALYNLGQNYIALDDWERGVPYLYKALEQKNISSLIKSSLYLLLAKYMINKKNYKEAIKFCEKSLKIIPSQIYARMLLSDALFYDNKADECIKILNEGYELSLVPEAEMKIETSLEVSYDPYYIQYLIARRYRALEKPKKAIEAYKKALHHKEDYYEARFELATLYFNENLIENAISQLENIKLNAIEDSKLLLDIAGLYIELGKNSETRKVLERALETDKENAKALFFLGNTYLDESNYDKAEKYYLKSYNADSNVKETILNLAFISIKKQNYEKALEYYKTLQSMFPDDESFARKVIALEMKIQFPKQ
jgi:tetratricopeptide (TPR) repeat protein